jgi:lipoprotein LpqH
MTACSRRVAPIVMAAALMVGCLVGCSSTPPAESQQAGTVPRGTATMSIDGRDAGTDQNVSCQTIGAVTTVTTGDQQAGSIAVISTDPDPHLQWASIRNLGGFTGSYGKGLGDPAQVTVADRTYQIAGTADGFATDNPSFRKAGTFSIQVSC